MKQGPKERKQRCGYGPTTNRCALSFGADAPSATSDPLTAGTNELLLDRRLQDKPAGL
jgi:hypothetical protein